MEVFFVSLNVRFYPCHESHSKPGTLLQAGYFVVAAGMRMRRTMAAVAGVVSWE
jgi:hypothetical protein